MAGVVAFILFIASSGDSSGGGGGGGRQRPKSSLKYGDLEYRGMKKTIRKIIDKRKFF